MDMNRHNNHQTITTTPVIKSVFINHAGKDAEVIQQTVKFRKTQVCWGIPMDELMYSLWFSNFIHLPVMPWDNISVTMSTYLVSARNAIHNNFLKKMNCEWLVMLDSDVLPPPAFLDQLIGSGKKMIGGWYRGKGGNSHPTVYDLADDKQEAWIWAQRKEPGKGIEKVGALGSGILLMHRSIAEIIGEEPFGRYMGGEDMVLCRILKEKGIDIFVDWSIACAHAGVNIV